MVLNECDFGDGQRRHRLLDEHAREHSRDIGNKVKDLWQEQPAGQLG